MLPVLTVFSLHPHPADHSLDDARGDNVLSGTRAPASILDLRVPRRWRGVYIYSVLYCHIFDATHGLTLHPPLMMEVGVIRGARRISSYSGYLSAFRWGGFWPAGPAAGPAGRCDQGRSCEASTPLPGADVKPEAMTVLVMDAQIVERCTRSSQVGSRVDPSVDLNLDLSRRLFPYLHSQFSRESMLRVLVKASLCFGSIGGSSRQDKGSEKQQQPRDLKISSGNWGCGVFGGNRFLKFLQQVLCRVVISVLLPYRARDRFVYDSH